MFPWWVITLTNLFHFIDLFLGLCCFDGLSLFAEGGYSLLRCSGFSLRWLLLLQRKGSRAFRLMVVVQELSNPESESEGCSLCLTLCDPMDYTVQGILQARILEWVAFPSSRGTSQPRNRTQVSHIAGELFTNWAMREALVALRHVESSQTRDWTCVSCIGRRILTHCTTREVLTLTNFS